MVLLSLIELLSTLVGGVCIMWKKYRRILNIWCGMMHRCYNPNNPHYSRYGGRGIDIFEDWRKDKVCFLTWALTNGYSKELSIDRIDNDKGYHPNNCRWATHRQQMLNRSNTKSLNKDTFLTYNNCSLTHEQWSVVLGGNLRLVEYRIKRGWSINDAISTPAGVRRKLK